jgi:uncharacterized protein (DUF952 family)
MNARDPHSTLSELVYKIAPRGEWEAAAREGVYRGSIADQRDGFIHFSTRSQVSTTLLRHFSGQSDLLLISFEAAALGNALRFEASRDGQLFPHLYGELSTSLAFEIVELA